MVIEVVDHMGVTIGHAVVKWDMAGGQANRAVLARQARDVLAAEHQCILPTKDERCPWKLVVKRDDYDN